MKLARHVDFDSLLSGAPPVSKVAEALNDGHQKSKTDSNNNEHNRLVDGMLAGAAGSAIGMVHQHNKSDKIINKIVKHEKKKLRYRIGKAIGKSVKPIIRTGRKVGDILLLRDRKREELLNRLAKSGQNTRRVGELGLGLTAGVAGVDAYNKYFGKGNSNNYEKKASDDDTRAQIARQVEIDSTPEGGAKRRAKDGAMIGGLAGLMYGTTKKSKIKGINPKILRGLWHGTSGAVWGAGALGAATYLKKKFSPDTEQDKEREYERRISKVASLETVDTDYSPLVISIAGLDKEVYKSNMIKTAQPRWAREAIKHVLSGHYSKAGKIIKNVRKGTTEGSTLSLPQLIASKYEAGNKKYLAHQMAFGNERRRLAKKAVRQRNLFIKDRLHQS